MSVLLWGLVYQFQGPYGVQILHGSINQERCHCEDALSRVSTDTRIRVMVPDIVPLQTSSIISVLIGSI